MILNAVGIVIGVLVGAVNGGRFAHVAQRKLRAWGVLPLAAACFAIPELIDNVHGAGAMHTLGFAAFAMFGIANLNLVAIPVVLFGVALNLIPLTFNGVMPVSQAAAVTVDLGKFDEFDDVDLGPGRAIESTTQRFVFLGDTIPISPIGQAISFGDLIIALGLANVAFRLLKPRRVRFKDEQSGWPDSAVPTENVSTDPWTAMLRGEIDDSAFEKQTAPQGRAPEPEWVQEPPVTTGPMVLPTTADPEAESEVPDALDLSLTWASPEVEQIEQSARQEIPSASESPVDEGSRNEGGSERSPFAPPATSEPSEELVDKSADPEDSKPLFDQDESHRDMMPSGRSFAPDLPDMDDSSPQRSDFERALASFDQDRREFQTDSQEAAEEPDDPKFTTGPIQLDENPKDTAT